MEASERDLDLRSRVVRLEHAFADHTARLVPIEQHKMETLIKDARREEQWKHIDERLTSIDKNILWLVRIIIATVIMAILALALRGVPLPT